MQRKNEHENRRSIRIGKKTKIGEGKKYLQMQINSSDKNGVTCFTPDFKYKL